MRLILPIYFIVLTALSAQSDQRIGQWKSYMSHSTGNFVTQSPQHIYFGTNGGLVAIDKSNEEVKFITRVEGLSGLAVQSMTWDFKHNQLLIAYTNSNLDLYNPETGVVINFPDIMRNTRILGDRFIYRMYMPEGSDFAYLACGFGITELDLKKKEFGFTTFTGIPVYEVSLFKNKLYAATESGVYQINYDKTKVNPSDFGQWSPVPVFGTSPFTAISNFNGNIYLGSGEHVWSWDGVGNPSIVINDPGYSVQYLSPGANQLLAGYQCRNNCDGALFSLDKQNNVINLDASCVPRPLYGIIDDQGRGWFADRFQAFRSNTSLTQSCTFKYFNTPLTPNSTDIALAGNRIYVAAGGIDASYSYLFRGDGFFSYADGIWRSYHRGNNEVIRNADLVDMYKMASDPVSNKLYVGTYWGGLMQCDMTDATKPLIKIFDKTNSSLQGTQGDVARTRIGGLTFDRNGNLWMSNYLAERPISVMKTDGTWKSFSVPTGSNLLACATDSSGYLWFSVIGQGLIVYDPGENIDLTTDDRIRVFNNSNSVMESNVINSLASDSDGSTWVGTNNGVYVFECGESVFEPDCKGSKRIVIQQGLGSNLLNGEDVQAIAIDGANRKWFGSRNGIFVQSSAGDQQIARYTIENSPLFDNLITVLRYDPLTGIMYVGTGSGIQSLRTDATAGSRSNTFSEIYAFPNPVRPEYSGPITVLGIRRNSNIKVTDFNGQVVHQGKSNGGTYVWNGLDLAGSRIVSGVYFVLISAGDGFEKPDTKIVKIAVIK
ncbi:MAG: two-component regulator propeller domain-containing protein [Saprospiraceae bacterium]|nr:two-component regulator propeller domain-containing protein [Saprospiraceae bacterium]